jgi:hypothetical protein
MCPNLEVLVTARAAQLGQVADDLAEMQVDLVEENYNSPA